MARWKFEPTPEQRSLVENLVAFGIPYESIAQLVKHRGKPVALNTLRLHFKDELELGGHKANAKVIGALFNNATSGNVTAQIFWAKTRCGWHETPQPPREDVLALKGSVGTPMASAVPSAIMAARVAKLSNEELDAALKASMILYSDDGDTA